MKTLVEPFIGFCGRGTPYLRAWQHRKTMSVGWSDGTLWDYHEFRSELDCDAMNAALLEIWRRYRLQCSRGASFACGGVCGGIARVPIAAGVEAMDVVRKYFTEALERLQARENIQK
jgi:hypothetical protein